MSDKRDKWYYYRSSESATGLARPHEAVEERSWTLTGAAALAYATLGALAVLAWQCYRYLKLGVWPTLTVIDAMKAAGIDWATRPTDWLGVYALLAKTSLALAIFGLGLLALVLSIPIEGMAALGRARDLDKALAKEKARKRSLGYGDESEDG